MSIFQPWKMQRRPFSSLRARASEAQRCGQPSLRKPTLPSVARKATKFSPSRRTRRGAPSASRRPSAAPGSRTRAASRPSACPARPASEARSRPASAPGPPARSWSEAKATPHPRARQSDHDPITSGERPCLISSPPTASPTRLAARFRRRHRQGERARHAGEPRNRRCRRRAHRLFAHGRRALLLGPGDDQEGDHLGVAAPAVGLFPKEGEVSMQIRMDGDFTNVPGGLPIVVAGQVVARWRRRCQDRAGCRDRESRARGARSLRG